MKQNRNQGKMKTQGLTLVTGFFPFFLKFFSINLKLDAALKLLPCNEFSLTLFASLPSH